MSCHTEVWKRILITPSPAEVGCRQDSEKFAHVLRMESMRRSLHLGFLPAGMAWVSKRFNLA